MAASDSRLAPSTQTQTPHPYQPEADAFERSIGRHYQQHILQVHQQPAEPRAAAGSAIASSPSAVSALAHGNSACGSFATDSIGPVWPSEIPQSPNLLDDLPPMGVIPHTQTVDSSFAVASSIGNQTSNTSSTTLAGNVPAAAAAPLTAPDQLGMTACALMESGEPSALRFGPKRDRFGTEGPYARYAVPPPLLSDTADARTPSTRPLHSYKQTNAHAAGSATGNSGTDKPNFITRINQGNIAVAELPTNNSASTSSTIRTHPADNDEAHAVGYTSRWAVALHRPPGEKLGLKIRS